MLSVYPNMSYPSTKIAQAYLLASKVKAKLSQEAVKSDINLHRLVCQANLLDNLIDDLNRYDKTPDPYSSSHKVSYESINTESDPYSLLDVMNDKQNFKSGAFSDEDGLKYEIVYTSDDSDSDESDDDEGGDDVFYHDGEDEAITDSSHLGQTEVDICSALDNLNIKAKPGSPIYQIENRCFSNSINRTDDTTVEYTLASSDSEDDSDYSSDSEGDTYEMNSMYALTREHSQDVHFPQFTEVTTEVENRSEENENCTETDSSSDEDLSSLSNCSSVASFDNFEYIENSDLKTLSDLKLSVFSSPQVDSTDEFV